MQSLEAEMTDFAQITSQTPKTDLTRFSAVVQGLWKTLTSLAHGHTCRLANSEELRRDIGLEPSDSAPRLHEDQRKYVLRHMTLL